MMLSAVIGLMGGYDPDAVLYFNQLSPSPSIAFKAAVNRFIVGQKSGTNNFTKFVRFIIHASEYQQHARVCLKNPTATELTEVNTPTWTQWQGYTGNGTNMYLNLNFNLSSGTGGLISTNNVGFGHYITTNVAEIGIDGGAIIGTNRTYLQARRADGANADKLFAAVNSTGSYPTNPTTTDSRGLHFCLRGPGIFRIFKRESVLIPSDGSDYPASGVPNGNPFVMALNFNGTPSSFSSRRYAITIWTGSGIDYPLLRTGVAQLATDLGFAV